MSFFNFTQKTVVTTMTDVIIPMQIGIEGRREEAVGILNTNNFKSQNLFKVA